MRMSGSARVVGGRVFRIIHYTSSHARSESEKLWADQDVTEEVCVTQCLFVREQPLIRRYPPLKLASPSCSTN